MRYSGFALDDRVALITGAGRGLGWAIAAGLAAAGAQVLLNGRHPASLAAPVRAIHEAGDKAAALAFNVADEAETAHAFREIEQTYGRLDILVNNVGIRDRRGLFDFETAALRRMLDVNLVAPFELSRRAARLMQLNGYGRLINVTSIAADIAREGDAIYSAAKGGLTSLTRALAADLGQSGITANAISPGYFATETNASMVSDEAIATWLKQRTALGRWGIPSEIAGAAIFLASPAASYITGQVLTVDGGYVSHF